jgi:hypothetical protein
MALILPRPDWIIQGEVWMYLTSNIAPLGSLSLHKLSHRIQKCFQTTVHYSVVMISVFVNPCLYQICKITKFANNMYWCSFVRSTLIAFLPTSGVFWWRAYYVQYIYQGNCPCGVV